MTDVRRLLTELADLQADRLEVSYDWRSGKVGLEVGRYLDPHLPWDQYGKMFNPWTCLTMRPWSLRAGALDALEQQCQIGPGIQAFFASSLKTMLAARHERIVLIASPERDCAVLVCRHNTELGATNGRHAITAGGLRRHHLDEDVATTILDGLNLARAMTYKNAAAGVPCGGSKLILYADALDTESEPDLGFVAYCIDVSRSFTGPDMGLAPDHADALRRHFTRNIVGGEDHSFPTGPPTASGELQAIETVLRHMKGSLDWGQTRIGILGLGAVGGSLGSSILERGGEVLISDIDPGRVQAFLARNSSQRVQVLEPEELLVADLDVLAPSAAGGLVDATVIPTLNCRALIGAANNQLAAETREEEFELAEQLQAAGITFLIEWQHNVGGVLAGWEEWREQESADESNIAPAIDRICGPGIEQILAAASTRGTTPTAVAYAQIDDVLGYAS